MLVLLKILTRKISHYKKHVFQADAFSIAGLPPVINATLFSSFFIFYSIKEVQPLIRLW
jgi:hypothetical protein